MERAWAAGFFDGEGHVGCFRYKAKPHQLRIMVTQTRKPTLERLKAALGDFGAVAGPYGPYTGGKSQFWTLRITSNGEVMTAMSSIWPWLSAPKREQFKNAMLKFRGAN